MGTQTHDPNSSTGSSRTVVARRYDWSSVPPTQALVDSLQAADVLGSLKDDDFILQERVDIDSIYTLVVDNDADACVHFTVRGHKVRVTSEGLVMVTAPVEAQ